MEKERYVMFDWAMKRMLRDKANFAVLEGLLTVLLGEKITILEMLESEANQTHEDDKFNRVDIKAKDSKGDIILVEVQNTREVYYLERVLYGVAKAIISVCFLYFDLGKGNDCLYHGQTTFKGVHTGDCLELTTRQRDAIVRKLPEEIFPEYYLIRVNEFNSVAKTPLEEWIRYLKTGEIRPDDTAPGLPEARSRLRYYDMDPIERHNYDEHINAVMIQNDVLENARLEGLIEGRAEGMEQGRAEGMAQGRSELIATMLKNGVAPADIARMTGLPMDEIIQG